MNFNEALRLKGAMVRINEILKVLFNRSKDKQRMERLIQDLHIESEYLGCLTAPIDIFLSVGNNEYGEIEHYHIFGGNLNIKDSEGRSLLHFAKSSKMIGYLLGEGIDVNVKDNKGATPLHNAIYVEQAKCLIDAGADVNAKDNRGYTPLHYAAHSRRAKIAQLLIDAGASEEAKDDKGRTPFEILKEDEKRFAELLDAIREDNCIKVEEIVDSKVYINAGAKIWADIIDEKYESEMIDSMSEVDKAKWKGFAKAEKYQDRASESALIVAIKSGASPHIIFQLEDAGADVNAKSIDTQDRHYTNVSEKAMPLYREARAHQEALVSGLRSHGLEVRDATEYVDLLKSTNTITPLYAAVENGREEIVRFLIYKRVNIEEGWDNPKGGKWGWAYDTPLALAVRNNELRITKLLLDAGANMDDVYGDNCSSGPALYIASSKNNIELVKLLLKYGADSSEFYGDYKTGEDETPLDAAVENENFEIIKMLIEALRNTSHYGCFRNYADILGQALFKAIENGNSAIVKLLLDEGANVKLSRKVDSGVVVTPLEFALARDNKIVQILKEYSAGNCQSNGNSEDTFNDEFPTTDFSDIPVNVDVHDTSAEKKTERQDIAELTEAICNNDIEKIKQLIASGVDVNATNQFGNTALHEALSEFNFDININCVQLLLDMGAEINKVNNCEETVLHRATQHAYDSEFIKLLIEHGADVNAKDIDGITPLHRVYDEATAKLLLDHGADANSADNEGNTALQMSVSRNRELVQLLVEQGADVNAKDIIGRTALHKCFGTFMSADEIIAIAELLIENGADINAKDANGKTPLHVAYGDDDFVSFLTGHGADANIKDNDGNTPKEAWEKVREDVDIPF